MFAKLSVTQQPVAADTKAMELSQQEMVDASTLKIGKHFFILIFLFLFFAKVLQNKLVLLPCFTARRS